MPPPQHRSNIFMDGAEPMRTLRMTALALACLGCIGPAVLWMTQKSAIPGAYRTQGSWGNSTLLLRPDHTFVQEGKFSTSPSSVQISGVWRADGRNFLVQDLTFKPFIVLGPYQRGKIVDVMSSSFGPILLTGLGIEVDSGANIVYRK
jgi:hypothetical protein